MKRRGPRSRLLVGKLSKSLSNILMKSRSRNFLEANVHVYSKRIMVLGQTMKSLMVQKLATLWALGKRGIQTGRYSHL